MLTPTEIYPYLQQQINLPDKHIPKLLVFRPLKTQLD